VMSAIESCRTAALGGHVARCEDCSHTQIAYNSCERNDMVGGYIALGSRIKTARLRSGMQTGRWLADHRPRSTEGEGRSTGKL